MIFIDTSFFLAVFSRRDQWHEKAMAYLAKNPIQRQPSDLFVTTNYVMFETITVLRAKAGHALAVSAGEDLLGRKMARIHRASEEEEQAAFEYLKKYRDQDYSPVDCLSFDVMDRLGINEALSFDAHFSHRFLVRTLT